MPRAWGGPIRRSADTKPYTIPLDFSQPILAQLRDLFFSLLEAP
jgi:hypothetical protein